MINEENLAIFIIELAAIALDYALGFVLLSKTLRLELGPPRRYYSGVVGFFITHAACRTVFLVRGYLVDADMADARVLLFDTGTILGLLCVVLLVAVIESTVYAVSKHGFTIAGTCALGVMVFDLFVRLTFHPYRLLIWIHYFTTPVLVAFIIGIYLRALLKATGATRTNAVVMLVAIVLLALSELANSTISAQLLGEVAKYIGPALMAATLILLYYAVVHLSVWKKAEPTATAKGGTPPS